MECSFLVILNMKTKKNGKKKNWGKPKGEKKNSYQAKIAQPPPLKNKMVHP